MNIPLDLVQKYIDLPSTALALTLAQRLQSIVSPHYVLFTEDCDFDIDGFIRHGGCELIESEKNFLLENTKFHLNRIETEFMMGVFNVRWREIDFTIVRAKSYDEYKTYSYIVAPSRTDSERLFQAVCDWATGANDAVTVFQSGYFDRNVELFAKIQCSNLKDLYLSEPILNQLRTGVFDFLDQKEMYHQNRLPWKRGLILHGPPGNGKSQVIQALIKETKLRSIYVRSLFDRYEDSESTVRNVFQRARILAPCILVFEDIDSLVHERMRSPFLNAMDGVGSADGILTIATTNHLGKLDVAIRKRPSRFDQLIEFPNPDLETRFGYLLRNLRNRDGGSIKGLWEAALRTEGASFASLQEVKRTFLTMRMRSSDDPQLLMLVLDQLEYNEKSKSKKKEKKDKKKKSKAN
jgi:hypothetical protein